MISSLGSHASLLILLFAYWVIFSGLVAFADLFFKKYFSKKFSQEHYQSVKQFGSRSGSTTEPLGSLKNMVFTLSTICDFLPG